MSAERAHVQEKIDEDVELHFRSMLVRLGPRFESLSFAVAVFSALFFVIGAFLGVISLSGFLSSEGISVSGLLVFDSYIRFGVFSAISSVTIVIMTMLWVYALAWREVFLFPKISKSVIVKESVFRVIPATLFYLYSIIDLLLLVDGTSEFRSSIEVSSYILLFFAFGVGILYIVLPVAGYFSEKSKATEGLEIGIGMKGLFATIACNMLLYYSLSLMLMMRADSQANDALTVWDWMIISFLPVLTNFLVYVIFIIFSVERKKSNDDQPKNVYSRRDSVMFTASLMVPILPLLFYNLLSVFFPYEINIYPVRLLRLGYDNIPYNLTLSHSSFRSVPVSLRTPDVVVGEECGKDESENKICNIVTPPVCIIIFGGDRIFVRPAINGTKCRKNRESKDEFHKNVTALRIDSVVSITRNVGGS